MMYGYHVAIIEPRYEKTCFKHMQNKGADQLINVFVFVAIPLLVKFQTSSFLLRLYSLVGNPEDMRSHDVAHYVCDVTWSDISKAYFYSVNRK